MSNHFIHLTNTRHKESRPIFVVAKDELSQLDIPQSGHDWIEAYGFSAKAGEVLLLPDMQGGLYGALLGCEGAYDSFVSGALSKALPSGYWHFATLPDNPAQTYLGLFLGAYSFDRYKAQKNDLKKSLSFYCEGVDVEHISRLYETIYMVRDMINTPPNVMNPQAIEERVRQLAQAYKAEVHVEVGDGLLAANFPLIHAVGRASAVAPRLIDLRWGEPAHPLLTLVGKGVSFDTGGLDIKPSSSMLMMKKDMGGAAHVLGLARLIMDAKLPVRLRLLIPAVENAVAGNAFRPSDVVLSRKGLQVEIGNTDAEGRLVLADALAYGDEEAPQLMLDMATLTGAGRIALGGPLPAFYCNDEGWAARLLKASEQVEDPFWRMPLWQPYQELLSSSVADINNVGSSPYGGSIIAALFLQKFVEKAKAWAHFDMYAWRQKAAPQGPIGAEAQAVRAIYEELKAGL
ncbi:leucyl aminopeptidase family protein [Bartonella sp. DGB2]|uniref:leucyl aminopeptidase family protein n=1 Tax=Bartonella sp. DGB2 TaxID=3388426 RepID=UPI00398FA736